jgi:hypothetical protein
MKKIRSQFAMKKYGLSSPLKNMISVRHEKIWKEGLFTTKKTLNFKL